MRRLRIVSLLPFSVSGFLSRTTPDRELVAVLPAAESADAGRMAVVTSVPLNDVITSPALMPAFAAAESSVDRRHQHAVLGTEISGELIATDPRP